MANQYSGKIMEDRIEGDKVVVEAVLAKEGINRGYNVLLTFEKNSKMKKILKNNNNLLVTFGRRSLLASFRGLINEDVEIPSGEGRLDIIIKRSRGLLGITFLKNPIKSKKGDLFLAKYLKKNKGVSVKFF